MFTRRKNVTKEINNFGKCSPFVMVLKTNEKADARIHKAYLLQKTLLFLRMNCN